MAACDFQGLVGQVPDAWRFARGWLERLITIIQTQLEQGDKIKLAIAGTLTVDFPDLWGDCAVPIGAMVVVQNAPPDQYYWDGSSWLQLNASSQGIVPVGGMVEWSGTTPPARYLWCDGKTIGDASSSATALAHADAQALFVHLWDSYDNTIAIIYNSAGTPVSRGASGLADFNNHRRIALPDHRGRISVTKDNLGGTSANNTTNVNADSFGYKFGAEFHTLLAAELAAHNHTLINGDNIPLYRSGGFTNAYYMTSQADFNRSSTRNSTDNNTGGGGSHNNLQPSVTEGKIIRY